MFYGGLDPFCIYYVYNSFHLSIYEWKVCSFRIVALQKTIKNLTEQMKTREYSTCILFFKVQCNLFFFLRKCSMYKIPHTWHVKTLLKENFSGCNFEPLFINLHNVDVYVQVQANKKFSGNIENILYLNGIRCMMLLRCTIIQTLPSNFKDHTQID